MAINFSGISGLSGLYSDYATVKNGSYKKLLNAYYSKVEGSKEATMKMFSQKSLSDYNIHGSEDSNLVSAKSSADSLVSSSSSLTNRGKDSIFQKSEVENVNKETGERTVTYEYDKEEIKSAVSQFVSDYNSMLDKAADTDSTKVMEKTLNMIDSTNVYRNSLAKIGITIGSDNKLVIDEEKFDKANMTSVKSLFNDTNSFGQKTMQRAQQISNEAMKEQLKASLYTSNGSYKANDYVSLLNMYL